MFDWEFEILPNGAIVFAKRPGVVLALYRGDFVTWCIDDEQNCFWGHYFRRDIVAAVASFNKRRSYADE